jgi:hypothetical protein
MPAATGATASGGSLDAAAGGRPAPLSAAERMRRSRARRRAEIEQRRAEAARAPLRLLLAAQAEADLARIEEHLDEGARGLALAERTLEGAAAVILRLYGHPLLRLAETANAPPELLAELLECSRIEAARLAQDAQRELLDRLFGRAPQAKGAGETPAVAVQLNVTPAVAAALNLVPDQGDSGGQAA